MSQTKIIEHVVKSAVRTFTVDEIRTFDTPIELIPTPGEGKFIEIIKMLTISKPAEENPVSYGAQPINLTYGSSGENAIDNTLHWGVLNCSHEKITISEGILEDTELDQGFDEYVNKPIFISVQSQPEQTGNGIITIKVTYLEHNI